MSFKVYNSSWKGREYVSKFKQILNVKLTVSFFLVSAFSPLSSWLSKSLWAILIVLTRANEIPSVVIKQKYRPTPLLDTF